jgi:hypothetical protein
VIFQYYPDKDMLYIKLADKISTESEEAAISNFPLEKGIRGIFQTLSG